MGEDHAGRCGNPSQVIATTFGSQYVHTDLNHRDFLDVAARDPGLEEVYRDDQAVIFKVIADRGGNAQNKVAAPAGEGQSGNLLTETPGCPGVSFQMTHKWGGYIPGILTPICANAAGSPPSAGELICICETLSPCTVTI